MLNYQCYVSVLFAQSYGFLNYEDEQKLINSVLFSPVITGCYLDVALFSPRL